ncbi:unnamed protein product [Heterobilharzia americana]|nr:unnamed protein product [Heterobilharzia americana]
MKLPWLFSLTLFLALFVHNLSAISSYHLQRHKDHRNGSQPNVFQCISCKSGTQKVLDVILSPATKITVTEKIKMLCLKTGPFYNSCNDFVSELSVHIFDVMGKLEPQKWCAFLGFCYYPPNVPVCEYCCKTGQLIKSMLLAEKFTEGLYNNTLAMCNYVPIYSFFAVHFCMIIYGFQRFCQNAGFC